MKTQVCLVVALALGLVIYSLDENDDNPKLKQKVEASQVTTNNTQNETVVMAETPPQAFTENEVDPTESLPIESQTNDKQETLKAQPEQLHLDSIAQEEGPNTIFDSQKVKNLSLADSRQLIVDLSLQMQAEKSQETIDAINEYLSAEVQQYSDINLDTAACSDKLCGVIFYSNDRTSTNLALERMVNHEPIKKNLRGGLLRVLQDNGEYYGILISSIGNKPLKIN